MDGKAEQQLLFLGFDTSAYTTSMALVDGNEALLRERRIQLPVPRGGLGLRQSEAVFKHLENITSIWTGSTAVLKRGRLAAVAASVRPRPLARSYMPVFKVGEAFANVIAQTLSLPFMPLSHQEGHIQAGLWSAGLPRGRYAVMHISGGTTELLDVTEESPGRMKIEPAGGSADLNAGQFIDRIGVAMGLDFPAGPGLEKMARYCSGELPVLPVAVKGTAASFSGPASQAARLLEKGCDRAALARAVEICVADSLAAAIIALPGLSKFQGVLLVGGVAANEFIRRRMAAKLEGLPLASADPAFAGDNAAGIAVQAARRHLHSKIT